MKKLFSGWLIVIASGLSPAWAGNPVLEQSAIVGRQAMHAVLQDVARAGDRLVAVGERGVVLLSDDNGTSWRQASAVPVSASLSAVQFVDEHHGWAVGHAGVVLKSEDGGEHWTLQLDGLRAAALELGSAKESGNQARIDAAEHLVEDGADKPLLALDFTDAQRGMVFGAYGLAFMTQDGGQSWESIMDRLPNPRGLHIYAVTRSKDAMIVAGEQGLLLRSSDEGEQFNAVQAPYEGSLFTAATFPDGRMAVGGLRGNLFSSSDDGMSFQTLANPVPASVNGMRVVGDQLVLANQAGMVLRGGLASFSPRPQMVTDGLPLTAVTQTADGALVAVGMAGARRVAATSNLSSAD
ncbi:YCF48-related protein [Pseudomonas sp. CC120222-01a]|uniref:WD40/YVTN/BNR-like repeat-containing protein n=1 Tax=Pseudomonas sp. CC120222-01a TaxID=1378075 RepID=UPI000D88D056|nr:YCF48-related protein [Pseudomonas sp. CC120222-01a]PVZ42513.1 photosystem II stability/assembly factor-like uncharacterized protein [Pseudomonas sp. CC120222-01a]